jgi:hypothetical protein
LSICGFTLSTGPLCYDEPQEKDKYCPRHEGMSTCVSCGKRASRECPGFDISTTERCQVPLCANCEHKEFNAHGPIVPPVEQARQGLVESMKVGLKDARNQGLCDIPDESMLRLAGMLVDHMSLSVFAQVLSGMNMPR